MSLQIKESSPMIEFNEEKKALLKTTIAKNCTDAELEMFIHVCKSTNLDPFRKQVYAIKMGGVMTIQMGIDGYRIIADRSGKYAPGREPTFTYDSKGILASATSYVKKMSADGTWHEVAATALMKEQGSDKNLWGKMPHVMLAKVAESAALRRAFPGELGGLYTREEMHQAESPIELDMQDSEVSEEEVAKVSIDQATTIRDMIGDDLEFRVNLLKQFGVVKFGLLPANKYEHICELINVHNQIRLRKEMQNQETA